MVSNLQPNLRADIEELVTRYKLLFKNKKSGFISDYQKKPNAKRFLTNLSNLVDQIIIDLAAAINMPQDISITAVGGYGRQEMFPGSDADLLILFDEPIDDLRAEIIEIFISSLWDIGLNLGHSVRTINQCLDLAATDVVTQTALLEARYLCGNQRLYNNLSDQLVANLDDKAFFLAKRMEMRHRHAHYHNTPYALEPNCKESPGALRDLQLLLWLAKASGYGGTWKEVTRAGALSIHEYRSLLKADRAFKRLRVDLHILTSRAEDRLLFDLQPELAQVYGFRSCNNNRASELLMQRYYWAARVVTQLTTILIQAIEERLFPAVGKPKSLDKNFQIVSSRLDIKKTEAIESDPKLIFTAFLHMQSNNQISSMTAKTLRAIWHSRHLINKKFRSENTNKKLFIDILKQPRMITRALYSMNMLGILPRYIPEFRQVSGKMQHDLFHVYTVDEHTLKVIKNLRSFCINDTVHEYPLANAIMQTFDKVWLIYIAALFHDIAKGQGVNHSERGAQIAESFCQKHGLSQKETRLVVFLVRYHLLMSITSQKKDLSNPEIIEEFSKIVGDLYNLNALYVLTISDIKATNPNVWNTWKAKLLDSLYNKSKLVLTGANVPSVANLAVERRQLAAKKICDLGIDKSLKDNFWKYLDDDYFLRHEVDDIVWHTISVSPKLACKESMVISRNIKNTDALQVMVWIPDMVDLFAKICEYFDINKLSVQEARVYTTRHGYALDSFIVLRNAAQHDCPSQQPNNIEVDLLAHLMSAKELTESNKYATNRGYRSTRLIRETNAFPLSTNIDLHLDEKSGLWKLAVSCIDRRGLLLSIAMVLKDYDIDIKIAKIHTMGGRAEDVFVIYGPKLTNRSIRMQFEHQLRKSIDTH